MTALVRIQLPGCGREQYAGRSGRRMGRKVEVPTHGRRGLDAYCRATPRPRLKNVHRIGSGASALPGWGS